MPRSARDPLAAYLLIQAGLLRRRDLPPVLGAHAIQQAQILEDLGAFVRDLPQSDERLTTRDRAVTCGQSWRPGQRPRDLRAATPAGPGRASTPPPTLPAPGAVGSGAGAVDGAGCGATARRRWRPFVAFVGSVPTTWKYSTSGLDWRAHLSR